MNEIAIRVENLSKRYRIGKTVEHRDGREPLLQKVFAPFRYLASTLREPEPDEIIWALKDVSFEVKHGEVMGIIGRNGAGKSTLLKILSRITEPTEGRAVINGRVGSLLEVGTGFHPELTGRENIYLNGAILGMRRAEIERKFDEIVAFAETEKFLDTPVKRYSSGMYVRLAFAVASHMEPEILLVDEVLAVGDAAFQKKCLGKMGDVAKEGRTVLFVSHNMASIRQLCQKAILIDNGTVNFIGSVSKCIDTYLRNGLDNSNTVSILEHISDINPAVEIETVTVNGVSSDKLHLPEEKQVIEIEITGRLSKPLRIEVEAKIFDLYETPLAFFSPGHERGYTDIHPVGPFRLVRSMKLPNIMRGEYYLYIYLTDPGFSWWAQMPRAVRLISEGTSTKTGLVFDYIKGAGWVFLSELPNSMIKNVRERKYKDEI